MKLINNYYGLKTLKIMTKLFVIIVVLFVIVAFVVAHIWNKARKEREQKIRRIIEEQEKKERERQEFERQERERLERERQEREREERERQERLKEEAMNRMREQKAREEAERVKNKYAKAKIFFQGIWVTQQQLSYLANFSEISSMQGKKLRDFLSNLGKTNPLFADFTQEAENSQKEKEKAKWDSYSQTKQNHGYRTTSANKGQTQRANVNSFYQMFGLTPETLTSESLKRAYRELVKKYHPDKNKEPDAAEKFQRVQKCYEYLQGELRRKAA